MTRQMEWEAKVTSVLLSLMPRREEKNTARILPQYYSVVYLCKGAILQEGARMHLVHKEGDWGL